MEGDHLASRNRRSFAAGLLIMDLVLLMCTGVAISLADGRGVLCDGDSVFCAGGDPTYRQWLAEMSFRSTVAYSSYGIAALVILVTLAFAVRRRRKGLVALQVVALIVVAALAALFDPVNGHH